jgi:hypothetical protein
MAAGNRGNPTLSWTNTIQRGETQAKDPGWEVAPQAEPETSVFVEPVDYRNGLFFGRLEAYSISDDGKPVFYDDTSVPGGITLRFSFEEVNIQNMFSFQVAACHIHGASAGTNEVGRRQISVDGSLCGDIIDDTLTGELRKYRFDSFQSGIWQFCDIADKSRIHVVEIFKSNGSDNGFYSVEEIFEFLKTRFKSFFETKFPGVTVNVEIFVNSRGRIEFAWGGAFFLTSTNFVGGGIIPDMDRNTSPILGILENFFIVERVNKSGVNYGTVSSGQSIELIRRDTDGSSVDTLLKAIPISYPNCILVCPELTRFQKEDCITPYAGNGEIATIFLVKSPGSIDYAAPPNQGADAVAGITTYYASEQQGNLQAPKVKFDPNYTLDRFVVELVTAKANPLFQTFFKELNFGGGAAANSNLESYLKDITQKKLSMSLFMKMY